jgi:hypothetical protein
MTLSSTVLLFFLRRFFGFCGRGMNFFDLATDDAVQKNLLPTRPAVGACKPSRDAIDLRIVKSVRDQTGTSRVSTTLKSRMNSAKICNPE